MDSVNEFEYAPPQLHPPLMTEDQLRVFLENNRIYPTFAVDAEIVTEDKVTLGLVYRMQSKNMEQGYRMWVDVYVLNTASGVAMVHKRKD